MNKIEFSLPDYNSFQGNDIKCADMHFHTNYSDGAATVDQVLEKIRKLNIGVAVTDHNEIRGSLEAFSKKRKDDFIIPGIEVKSLELIDILFYFYTVDEMKRFYERELSERKKRLLHSTKTTLPLKRLIQLSGLYKCVISVAHPYGYTLRTSIREVFGKYEHILRKIDVFEAINGGNTRKANEKAISYIKQNKKAISGGSDGHSITPLGRVMTYSKAKDINSFLDNIKNKKAYVVGQETRFGKIGEYGNFAVNKVKNIFRR
jgi:hypothetical protein